MVCDESFVNVFCVLNKADKLIFFSSAILQAIFLLVGLPDKMLLIGNRQRNRRIDLYEIIVLERSGTFQHYFVRGVLP